MTPTTLGEVSTAAAAVAALSARRAAAQPGILNDTATYTETYQQPRLAYTLGMGASKLGARYSLRLAIP